MTTRQKAKEIAKKNKVVRLVPCMDRDGRFKGYAESGSYMDCFKSAMDMSAWKNRILVKVLEAIIEKFNKYPDNAVFRKDNIIDVLKELSRVMVE